MKFFKEIKRESDGTIFKIGDRVDGVVAGRYYIGAIVENKQCFSGIQVSGYHTEEEVSKFKDYPEYTKCGFNDLNKIEHI